MITLTNPIQVPNSLGGTTHTSYDKMRVVSINSDPFSMTINAQVQLMVSSDPNQPTIQGNLSIVATGATPNVNLQVPNISFYHSVVLSGANLTTVQVWITGMQNNIENGLISMGTVVGVQTAGV